MAKFTFDLNKVIAQGDDRVIKLIFDQTITDWEFYYTAKYNFSDTDANAAIALNPSDMLLSMSVVDYTNTLEIPLGALVTNIEPGKYVHDIKVIKSGGPVNTIAKGTLTVNPHVTKRITE